MVNDLSSELSLYKYVDDCAVSEVDNNLKLNVKKINISLFINHPLAQPLVVNNCYGCPVTYSPNLGQRTPDREKTLIEN